MKIGERIIYDESGDKLVHHRKFNNDPYLEQAKQLRDAGVGVKGHNKLVGRIPMHLVGQWIKEAGLSWDDNEAVKDLIRKKMLSGEFDKFRVWEGTY